MPQGNFGPYYEDEDPFEPPPSSPPPTGGGTGGGGGGDFPVIPDPGSQPPTPPPSTGGGGGGGGGSSFSGLPPGFTPYNVPGAPVYTPVPYTRPTMEDAMNEPGYQFRLRSGQQALERSAAAKGLLRTGGTLSDLVEYGQNFGSGEYQGVTNRALAEWDRRENANRAAFAPIFDRWRIGANTGSQGHLARYQSQLSQWLQGQQPRPQLVPPDEPPPVPPGDVSSYSGGDPWTDQYQGDPWTDGAYY